MICAICKLNYDETEMNFHHLIPKCFHNNKRILKQYDKDFLNKNGVMLCIACHNKLHSCIDEKDMAFEFNTIDKLLEIEDIHKWSNWKQKHPDFTSSYNRMTLKKRGK
jgi:hypothetical protein